MGFCNLRSAFVAAILLCHCVTWTLSKHSFRHSGRWSRPRRQGTGLFLSSSYVLPGGEGSSLGWGPWGEVSPCSRTCGGGVASQKRICLEVRDGTPVCTGGDTKYFSCQTQDCPTSGDFRSEQCAEHDGTEFNGVRYSWVPYKNAPNQCELNCMPRGGRFFYRHSEKVVDGTRCSDDSFDVCVDGSCQPVGCDMMLGSQAKEDKCRVCRGNGTNCHTISGQIDSRDLTQGYNDVLLIPQGATTVIIAELRASNNYLALRSKENNVYYLNGNYHIDFPRTLVIAGALWTYERSSQGYAAPDKLRTLGPTTEPLYLSLLMQEDNVGIDYEYSVPSALAPPPNQQYNWVHEEYTPCSATCGGGWQTREVSCRSREELDVVDESLCDAGLKPASNATCNTQPCAARWVEGPWSPCSKPCGEAGTRSRQVHCEKIITNGYPSVVDDQECFSILGPKPKLYDECNKGARCPTWFTGPWKPCDKLCGEGKQTRQVVCHQRLNGKVEILADNACTDEKPTAEQSCYLHPCEGVDWVVSEWTGCDSCLSKERTRTAKCVTKDEKVVNASFCSNHPVPVLQEECEKTPDCNIVQWYATQWGNCSVQCGKGNQTRRVFCGKYDTLAVVVVKVPDEDCAAETKYKESKPCEIPPEKCPAEWFAGPWSECSKKCGGGDQYRKVMCLSGENKCDEEKILEDSQPCNTGPCDEDETLPLTSSTAQVYDEDYDLDYCDEDEEDEENLLIDDSSTTPATTTEEFMLSDSPWTPEGSGTDETSFTTLEELTSETGSGSEPTSDFTGSTESTVTIESSTEITGSTSTDETGAAETTESAGSGATEVSETAESSGTESTVAGSTEVTGSTVTEESESVSTTESGTTEITTTTDITTTDATTTTEVETTTSVTTEITTEESEAPEETTEIDETVFPDTTGTATEDLSTTEGSASTATEESTITDTTESDVTGSEETATTGTEDTASTGTEGTETTSTYTEETGSTVTEETGTTETGTTETGLTQGEGYFKYVWTYKTVESSLVETGSTESTIESSTGSETSTIGEDTSTWDWTSMYTPKRCKKRTAAKCAKTKFGCCPDMRTAAAGPFDEGCQTPATCKESKFGCCADGVSPAQGPKDYKCPVAPCNETLYGCCKSDGKTSAEGNNQEGCPPPPPKCKSSKFGCCKDGKTEAKGPKRKGCPENTPKAKGCAGSKHGCCHDNKTAASGPNDQGCPCAVTKYGCCPDGVATAAGPRMEGCVMSCNTSAYGCCPDGESPAHGPDHEGCCLQSRYKCCPDNYSPAKGPHLEGCGCEYSHFGCCPDNVTNAIGPDNEGCGCQYSQFGCCPDRHTVANGPNFEGCGCHTYQFGCCPDGVTVAKGENQRGCHCKESTHGCCGDGQTPAQGPDFQGCDCSTSRYGCCPDGVNEAKGEKFLGCADLPPNRQAGCALKSDRGTCSNWTVAWFFDVAYGGCSRFWYGGCGGNDNRFATKEECEGICIHPAPGDVCKLPQSKGGCYSYILRWHYDAQREQCAQFVYSGCLGNDNNFETREHCQAQCEPARSDDQCKLPLERGVCAGEYPRWGWDAGARRCEQFAWGGCGGNPNRFTSEAACVQRCDTPGALKQDCKLPVESGNCTEKLARWAFSQSENRCVPFYYTGCDGNNNNFEREDECTSTCPSAYEQDLCTLPSDVGDCADYRYRWFFDTAAQRCRQFYYGGCGGNNNNFGSERECERRCEQREATPPATTPPAPTRPAYTSPAATTTARAVVESPVDFCLLEADSGPCTNMETKWAYDSGAGRCRTFQYGGCGGNQNNFHNLEYCKYYCEDRIAASPVERDVCQLAMSAGPCGDSIVSWFYDAGSDTCSQFSYGGCEGNGNRFESREACEQRCRSGQTNVNVDSRTDVEGSPDEQEIPSECAITEGLESCVSGGRVWYYSVESRDCVPHDNPPAGDSCRVSGAFASQEECDRSCGTSRGLDVCRYAPDAGSCTDSIEKFYFDEAAGDCMPFMYSGCYGTPNRFSSLEDCRQTCRPQLSLAAACLQPPAPGACAGYSLRWYYDQPRDQCAQFVYTGCDGNDNNFETREACEGTCRSGPAPPAPAPPPPAPAPSPSSQPSSTPKQQVEAECEMPSSLEPCGGNSSVFYYDSNRGECLRADIGECRYSNSFRSDEECERRCGRFKGVDPCVYPVEVGPCRAAVEKVYFDGAACRQFSYGGCEGGPNRFSSVAECEEVCLPASGNEVLPDCEAYNSECLSLRCPYGVQRTRADDGCERCACVDVEVNCDSFADECNTLKCYYGVDKSVGRDGCERCTCLEHPCANAECGAGERCVALWGEGRYQPHCRLVNRPGFCPTGNLTLESCRRECNDDADCADPVAKCCVKGCSQLCLPGGGQHITTARPSPELPQAPQANAAETEPEVAASEGGKAKLRCLFHGNPPPTITWRRGEVTIEGDQGRYRLLSDGALEIVSLYRNDSGVYICVAENDLGTATQEVRLQVTDPTEIGASIAGEPDASVMGVLGQPLVVRCLAYGYPAPSVTWYRGDSLATGPMVPYLSPQYEVGRDNALLIRALDVDSLGPYLCSAYNGVDKPATWSVTVRARGEPGAQSPWLVGGDVYVTPRRPDYEPQEPVPPQETEQRNINPAPVSTRLNVLESRYSAGSTLDVTCDVEGYPPPAVQWLRDNQPLSNDDRTVVTDSRLLIEHLTVNDTGMYTCYAFNDYSNHESTEQIYVEGLYIPPTCNDNPSFANCELIVMTKLCQHRYYSKFCCKSCMQAGLLLAPQ